ncbi:DUF7674 family protein [Bacillus sp. EB01]|uniref:DUF7674 family protein n=1 Tax=Bacillus sp. EB01 TaxID=1347086 RepID=UPI0005C54183|nr:hypothetical protein [Bacillus sp. EB01]
MSIVIKKIEVMELLLKACPSYNERWTAFLATELGEKYSDNIYLNVQLDDFATYLVKIFKDNNTLEFPAIFNALELLLLNGNEYVKRAIAGLLEDLQLRTNDYDIKPFLLGESLNVWNHYIEFWEKGLKKERIT